MRALLHDGGIGREAPGQLFQASLGSSREDLQPFASTGGTRHSEERKTNMSKQVLIDALKAIGLRAVDANQAVDTVTETIAGELRKGERFSIPGFGTFAVSNRAARLGRNPRTGEEIKIKASKGVRFKAGAKLKASL
jgi:DNA-binding protein HU-beta